MLVLSNFMLFSQKSNLTIKKIPPKDAINSIEIIKSIENKNLICLFIIQEEDTSKYIPYIKEKIISKNSLSIEYLIYYFKVTKNNNDIPYIDNSQIAIEQYFIYSNNKKLCNELVSKEYSNLSKEQYITVSAINVANDYNKLELKMDKMCPNDKLTSYSNKILEIIKIAEKYPAITENPLSKDASQDIKLLQNEIKNLSSQNIILNIELDSNTTRLERLLNNNNQPPHFHYLSFSAQYNLGPKPSNTVNTNSQKYTSNITSKSGFGLGIDYHFILSDDETHEIATGIHFINNNVLLSADSVQFNYSQTDKDGEKYQRRIYGINIKEEANINFFNVPLYYTFNYKLNEKAKVYVKGGLQFMYIFSATYAATDGEFSYRGKYKGIKDEFENITEYDFYENQQVNKNTHNLDVKKFNTYGFIGGGFKYAIDKKTDFTIGMNVNIAGSNLLKQKTDTYITSQTANDYNSLLYSFDKFKINPISFEFGLVSKF